MLLITFLVVGLGCVRRNVDSSLSISSLPHNVHNYTNVGINPQEDFWPKRFICYSSKHVQGGPPSLSLSLSGLDQGPLHIVGLQLPALFTIRYARYGWRESRSINFTHSWTRFMLWNVLQIKSFMVPSSYPRIIASQLSVNLWICVTVRLSLILNMSSSSYTVGTWIAFLLCCGNHFSVKYFNPAGNCWNDRTPWEDFMGSPSLKLHGEVQF